MAGSVFLGSVYGTLEMRTEQWKKDIKSAQDDLENLEKTTNTRLASIGQTFTNVGKKLSVGLTAPLAVFGKLAVDTATEIEVRWKEVEKVYGSTADAFERDFGELSNAVEQLTLKFGQQKSVVLDALASISAMGYEGKDAIDMLTQSLEFATTGQMDLNEAMSGAIAISKIYGVSGDELRKVLASLNTVENTTAASMRDLNEAIQITGESGKSAGVDVKELSAMMAVFRERAIPAGEAADGLKMIFTRLRNETKESKKIYEKYGMSIYEGNGVLKEADVILKDLATIWPKLTDVEREELAQANAGVYQKNKFLTLMADLTSESSTYIKTLETLGDSENDVSNYTREMNVFLDTNKTKMAQASAAFTNFKVAVGGTLADVIIPLLTKLADLAKKFSELSPQTQKFIVIAGMIAAVLGPALIVIGTLITSLTAIATAIGIGVAPLLLIIAAIGLFAVLIVKMVKDIKNFINSLDEMKEAVKSVLSRIGDAISGFFGFFKTGDLTPKFLKAIGVDEDALVPRAMVAIRNFFNRIKDGITGFFDFLKSGDLTPKFLKALGVDEDAMIPTALVSLRNFFIRIKEIIFGFFEFLATGDLTGKFLRALGLDEDSWLMHALVGFRSFFINMWNGIVSFLSGVVNLIGAILKAFGSFFGWVWKNMIEPILYLMFAIIARIFYEIYNVIVKFLEFIFDGIVEIWTAIWNFISPYLEELKNMIIAAWNWIASTTTAIWTQIKNFFINNWILIESETNKALEAIKKFLNDAWNWIAGITKQLWELIKEYIITPIKDGFSFVMEKVSDAVKWLKGKWEELASFFEGMFDRIKNALVKPFEWAKNKIEEYANKIRELADKISPFHKESPSLVELVTRGVSEIRKQYMSLSDISLPPIAQSVSLSGIATPTVAGAGAAVSKTINNSPQFTVNVGIYAGSEMEKRALAKELADAYNEYLRSFGSNIE